MKKYLFMLVAVFAMSTAAFAQKGVTGFGVQGAYDDLNGQFGIGINHLALIAVKEAIRYGKQGTGYKGDQIDRPAAAVKEKRKEAKKCRWQEPQR